MRERGEPLPLDVAKAGGRVGQLAYSRRIEWVNVYLARLMTPDYDYIFPCIEPAQLVVLPQWVEISGLEHTDVRGGYKASKSTKWHQVWRCVPVFQRPLIRLPVRDFAAPAAHPPR